MRRAAISIPSNIAEGFRRRTLKDKIQFLSIAYGSGAELETQLGLALELDFMNPTDYKKLSNLMDKLMRMMNKAIRNLQQRA